MHMVADLLLSLPLSIAVKKNYLGCCARELVLVNKQDGLGCTALLWASDRGHVGCMRILLDVGRANVDGLRDDSWTALHVAAYNGRLEVAALLIERGTNINAVNDYDRTPLDNAYQAYQNSAEMVALLKSKDAKRASELAATTSTAAAP